MMMARTLAVLLLFCTAASLASSAPSADRVSNLIAQLSSVNPYDRRAAMESLGKSKDARAVQPLINRLGSESDAKFAAKALGSLGAPSVDPLIKALSNKNPMVRANAARALGMARHPKSVKPLLGMLRDPDTEVRVQVVEALGFSKDPSVVARMLTIYNNPDEEYEVQEAACSAIVRTGDKKAIDTLIARLRDGGQTGHVTAALAHLTDVKAVRAVAAGIKTLCPWNVADVWAEVGEPMVQPLTTLLTDPDADVRFGAAWGLRAVARKTKSAQALKLLADTLKDSDSDVRSESIQAIAAFGGDAATNLLVNALSDANAEVRDRAIDELKQLGDPRAVQPLCAKLTDPNEQIRRSAAYALTWFADPCSADALLSVVRDTSSTIRHDALFALSRTKDARALPLLLEALHDTDVHMRRAAVNGLGDFAGKDVVEPLIAALRDVDTEVQQTAAMNLGRIADKRATEPLIQLLGSPSKEVRRYAMSALGGIKDIRAVKPLLDLAHADPANSIDTLCVLAGLGEASAVDTLISTLDDKKIDDQTRHNTIWALGEIGDKRATPALLALLQKDAEGLGYYIIDALTAIRDPRAFDALAEIVRIPRSFDRWNAAYALSLLDDPRVDAFLMPYAEKGDMEVIAGADQFFIKRGIDRAIPALLDALNVVHSDSTLPEALVASGQPELVEAGKKWREEHPEDYLPEPDIPYARWGEARR